jgi:hypothetical protein
MIGLQRIGMTDLLGTEIEREVRWARRRRRAAALRACFLERGRRWESNPHGG